MQRDGSRNTNAVEQETARVEPADLVDVARVFVDRFAEAEVFEHAQCIRPDRNRRADVEQRRCLFVNFRFEAEFSEGERDSQTTNTAADDGDAHWPILT